MGDFASLILQQCINGVVMGCLYVMVALGLTLIYGVMNQINFAHADFVTLGAFASFFFVKWMGGGYLLSIGVSFIAGGLLGYIINLTIFAPLRERGDELRPLIATIGASVLLENGALVIFGPIPYQFDTPYGDVIRFGKIFFTEQIPLRDLI